MHFSSGINRPPYEAHDEFLQITSGCSHGSCKFCTFYKDSPFSLSPMEEIEADIKELAHSGWGFDRIYLQGADPFIRKTEDLLKIADIIYHYLPQVKSIGGYARVDNLQNKSVGEVRQLKEAGYSYFYFGVESGDDKNAGVYPLSDRAHNFPRRACHHACAHQWPGAGGQGGHDKPLAGNHGYQR